MKRPVGATCLAMIVLCSSLGIAWAMGERVSMHSGYMVRVAIVPEAHSILLNVPGAYRLRTQDASRVLHTGRGLHSVEVTANSGGLQVGDLAVPSNGLRIDAERDGVIAINGRRMRGQIEIVRLDDARVRVINRVDLEDYVAAVLVSEVPHDWPLQALMAQAVASRTYAVHQHATRTHTDYDLTGDVSSQVYGGRNVERRRTDHAVLMTRGLVLTYQGHVFPAFFHAACGGRTEAARELWQIDIPPLAGRACPFDRDSPHYRWTRSIPLLTVEGELRAAGVDVGTLQALHSASWTASGRLKSVRVIGARGSATMSAKSLRAALGAETMKSTLVTLAVHDGALLMRGHGWGHGVGLCQWGALGMATIGYAFTDIVQYYYPGAQISRLPPVASGTIGVAAP